MRKVRVERMKKELYVEIEKNVSMVDFVDEIEKNGFNLAIENGNIYLLDIKK